jgi:hypothetical protein
MNPDTESMARNAMDLLQTGEPDEESDSHASAGLHAAMAGR